MLIHKSTSKGKKPKLLAWIFIAGIAALLLYALLPKSSEQTYFCDMEELDATGKLFLSQGKEFNNGASQSDLRAYAGKYSSRCDADQPYGPGYNFKHVYAGDVFEASIWINAETAFGSLVFQGDWGYFSFQKSGNKTVGDWQQLKKTITVPIGVYDGTLTIYGYIQGKIGAVYFDNLKIKKIGNKNPALLAASDATEYTRMKIEVDPNDYEALQQKRLEAYDYGNLIAGKKDLVPAKLSVGDTTFNAHVRLKGDLLDHLTGKKWSFRVHTDPGFAWKGMKVFSVHNSASRYHAGEWVFHEMLQQEDILTTKYDFIELTLNDEVLGIYAYEEHFLKQMLQSQQRTEGPIVKINEDAHWQYAPKELKYKVPTFESAQIEPFDKDALKSSNSYKAAFEQAQQLLFDFMHGDAPVEKVFDADLMAKFLAIQDVCNAWHSFNYTNLRFYYNKNTGLLEPIGYDGFSGPGAVYYGTTFVTGSEINEASQIDRPAQRRILRFHKKLFTNYAFAEQYIDYLERFISKDYLDEFKTALEPGLRQREAIIQREHVNYAFKWDDFFNNAKQIRAVLWPSKNVSLKAFKKDGGILINSYHLLPMEIVGLGDKAPTIKLDKKTILPAYDKNQKVPETILPAYSGAKNIFVKTLGTDSLVAFPIFKWTAPTTNLALNNALKKQVDFKFIRSTAKGYFIPAGNHVLQKSLVALDKPLIISAGAKLNLQNGAAIISKQGIIAEGSKDTPIWIGSADGTGQGVLISESKMASAFSNVTFSNLASVNQFNLRPEGAITIYDSKATFARCVFAKARAKDALHLDQASYDLTDCVVMNSSSDGIDANFSFGSIAGLVSNDIAKDGIEISGGSLQLSDSRQEQIGRAGVVANFGGKITITNHQIDNSLEGLKSIDDSKIIGQQISLKNVSTGILAFRKNDERQGGIIQISETTMEAVKQEHALDNFSKMIVNAQAISPQ